MDSPVVFTTCRGKPTEAVFANIRLVCFFRPEVAVIDCDDIENFVTLTVNSREFL